MEKIILGFVGELASGKGTACKYLKEKYHASVYRFSTILRDILDRLYIEQSRNNMQKLSLQLRQLFGDDLLASVIAKDVAKDSKTVIAVDGVRRFPDIKYLQKMPNFHLVHIFADEKSRYERIIRRDENSDDVKKTFDQFHKDGMAEAEQSIREVAQKAKFKIDNNGSLDNLYKNIDEIVGKIKEQC
ncbi:hypothetical protein C4569_01685 [Candidatus Parcubacteria bacterium]|nr:MAG: hypothetical protein C4569_01685 [Candidatus Parcubacteria bacterium]